MQRLENLLGRENIEISQVSIKDKSFKIKFNIVGTKNANKYKIDIDFKLSCIGKVDLKKLAKTSIDSVIKDLIKYIKSFDYTFYIVKDTIYNKEEFINKLKKLC